MHDYIRRFRIANVRKTLFSHNRVQLRPRYQLQRKGRKILFLNSFKSWRHADLIVKAAPKVLSEFPDAHFLLVGARNPVEMGPIVALVKNMGLQVHFSVLPYVSNSGDWLESATIYVLPADIVFCNNSLLEAMERGTPPVVARVPGAERIVEHGKSGLCEKQTPEAFASAIRTLLGNENLRRRLAEGARKKIERDFNESQRAEMLLSAYRSKVWQCL